MKLKVELLNKWLLRLLSVSICLVGGLGLVVTAWAFLKVAIIGFFNPPTRAAYNFGSEAMVGHGGWTYLSWQYYSGSALFEAAIYATVVILGFLGFRKQSWKKELTAFVLLVFLFALAQWKPGSVE